MAAEGNLSAMRVLVVEDEKKTASFVRKALQAEGFAVDVLHDGSEALSAVMNTPFDVAVLDVMLPGRDGFSVVRQMREKGIGIPVLLLTARGKVSEKVEGLNAGADDYLRSRLPWRNWWRACAHSDAAQVKPRRSRCALVI